MHMALSSADWVSYAYVESMDEMYYTEGNNTEYDWC